MEATRKQLVVLVVTTTILTTIFISMILTYGFNNW